MQLNTSIQVAISQLVQDYTTRSATTNNEKLRYLNYVLNEYNRVTGKTDRTVYSIGPYPRSIATYLLLHWPHTITCSNLQGLVYISKCSISIKPRRGATQMVGLTIEDIEALMHKTVVERLPEHVTAYLDLLHWKEKL
jgi:hypothetical protein